MSAVWEKITTWKEKGFITELEQEFVRFLMELDTRISDEVLLAATACIHAQRNGHLCLNLDMFKKDQYLFDESETDVRLNKETFSDWKMALEKCELVSTGDSLQPLVLEEGRLYLHRFWKYEMEFCQWIKDKAELKHEITPDVVNVLRTLLPPAKDLFDVNWQHVAVILSFLKDLVVITGGPGTGKTYTVLTLIAAHARVHSKDTFSIGLAAPTGKAARRLIESIKDSTIELPQELQEKIELPETALTVHKMLGADYRGRSFRFNEQNPLPYDLVVVDEASMLDINMWVRLTRAVGPHTKLIVLGDKDQLASVEAGSILGDLCQGENAFSKPVAEVIQKVHGASVPVKGSVVPAINDCIVFLTKSYRFEARSGIQRLSKAINAGKADEAISILEDEQFPDVAWWDYSVDNLSKITKIFGVDHYMEYMSGRTEDRETASSKRKILCAIRKSPAGVEQLNKRIEADIKREKGKLQSEEWYDGRPVMATKNDAVLRIKNGEIGLYSESDEMISFEDEYESKVSSARLKNYEPAFAITVHKSQGSEFEKVVIILPNQMNSVLSKEILYTSVTRARENTLVIAKRDILEKTIQQSVERNSGVKHKIWGT